MPIEAFFVAMMTLTVGTALVRHLLGTLHALPDPPPLDVEPDGRRRPLLR